MATHVTVELIEPGRSPEMEVLEVPPGREFQLIWSDAAPPLRRLLLRGGERQLQAAGERPFLWLRAPDRAGAGFLVLQVDRDIVGEPRIEAPGGLVVPVEQDARLSARAELLLDPPGQAPIRVELRILDKRAPDVDSFKGGTGGFGEGGSGATPETNWKVPGFFDSVVKPAMNRFNALTERVLQKVRRGPSGALRYILFLGLLLGSMGFAFYQNRQAKQARADQAVAEAAADQASDAATASAEDAGTCRSELAALQRMMLDPDQARRTLIGQTLDRTLARAAVLAEVPESPERDAALRRDELDRSQLVAVVEAAMADLDLDSEERGWLSTRLENAAALGDDLPDHMVLWHPRPDKREDPHMTEWSSGGSSLRGPWGLGERALRLVGDYEGDVETDPRKPEAAQDPRNQADWSLETLRKGLVSLRGVLLGRSTRGRLAVAPEQVHLWSLALWFAWNELPPAGPEGGLSPCVGTLLDGAAGGEAAEPGKPILPSIEDVVGEGGWPLRLKRSAACPWRDDDLVTGARLALQTVAETSQVRLDDGAL